MGETLEEQSQLIEPFAADKVRLVQITDCHIFAAADDRLLGLNTRQSFEAVKAAMVRDSGELDLLLATGDLSQDGSAESYGYLAHQFEEMAIPTFWLPGNHDEAGALAQHFRGRQIYAAKRVLVGGWQIVMLDSTIRGEVHGRVSESQLGFLDASLRQQPEKHALVCLHHQALATGSEWIDRKGLKDADQLRGRLAQHDNIRAVLWGHVHQEAHHSIDKVEWMSTPSSCVQFEPNSRDFAAGTEAPGYRLLTLNADGSIETAVHRVDSIDFEIDYSMTSY